MSWMGLYILWTKDTTHWNYSICLYENISKAYIWWCIYMRKNSAHATNQFFPVGRILNAFLSHSETDVLSIKVCTTDGWATNNVINYYTCVWACMYMYMYMHVHVHVHACTCVSKMTPPRYAMVSDTKLSKLRHSDCAHTCNWDTKSVFLEIISRIHEMFKLWKFLQR